MRKLIVGILALFLSFSVLAERPRDDGIKKAYFGFGGSVFRADDGTDSIQPLNVYGRLGYDWVSWFGIGIEGSTTISKDDIDSLPGVDFSVSTTFVYLRFGIPVASKSKIYLMAGPSRVELRASGGGASASVDDDDIGIGLGYEHNFDGYGFTVDYIQYYDNNNVDVGAVNIGLIGYF
jgi:hypothetical protein